MFLKLLIRPEKLHDLDEHALQNDRYSDIRRSTLEERVAAGVAA